MGEGCGCGPRIYIDFRPDRFDFTARDSQLHPETGPLRYQRASSLIGTSGSRQMSALGSGQFGSLLGDQQLGRASSTVQGCGGQDQAAPETALLRQYGKA